MKRRLSMTCRSLLGCAGILLASCGPADRNAIDSAPANLSAQCTPLPEHIAGRVIVDNPVTDGPFESHLNRSWSKGSEIIELRWLPVLKIGGLHEMLVYTDAAGEMFVIAGFPKDDFDLGLELGSLVIQVGPFNPTDEFSEDLSPDSKRRVIVSGEDLSGAWKKMRTVAAIIDKLGLDYDLAGPNSNSATETILKYTGIASPHPAFVGDIGADFDLLQIADGQACDDTNDDVDQVLK